VKRIRLPKRPTPRVEPEAPVFDPAPIEALLQDAVLDVLDGSPPGPLFASRVQRVCIDALRHAGIRGRVHTDDTGQHVTVLVQVGKRVERVLVTVAPF